MPLTFYHVVSTCSVYISNLYSVQSRYGHMCIRYHRIQTDNGGMLHPGYEQRLNTDHPQWRKFVFTWSCLQKTVTEITSWARYTFQISCLLLFFSERELTFTFAICYRRSVRVCRLSVICLFVCLSVTLVHPTQSVEIFGNFSSPFGTFDIHWNPWKILGRLSQGHPFVGGGV